MVAKNAGDSLVVQGRRRDPFEIVAYALLLRYAWQNDYCYPSQELVAQNMGVTSRSLITYLKELQKVGWITVERRGQSKSNIYELDLKPTGFRSQK